MLDTDVLIDVLRGYPPAVEWLDSLDNKSVLKVPGFVAMELVHGARNREEQARVEAVLEQRPILWPTEETCERAWSLFRLLHLPQGTGILDVLIGQMAIDLSLPLCSFNRKHYAGIEGLRLLSPYSKNN